jgi:hypothetical protein
MKVKLVMSALLLAGAVLVAFSVKENAQVKHIVIFKYKASATPGQIAEATEAFKNLKNKIPGIVSFEYGTNISPEGKNKGFTHVYFLTFKDEAARDKYLPHPDHNKFGELLTKLDVVEDVFVIDYKAQ